MNLQSNIHHYSEKIAHDLERYEQADEKDKEVILRSLEFRCYGFLRLLCKDLKMTSYQEHDLAKKLSRIYVKKVSDDLTSVRSLIFKCVSGGVSIAAGAAFGVGGFSTIKDTQDMYRNFGEAAKLGGQAVESGNAISDGYKNSDQTKHQNELDLKKERKQQFSQAMNDFDNQEKKYAQSVDEMNRTFHNTFSETVR